MPKHNHAFDGRNSMYDVGKQGGFGCAISSQNSTTYVATSNFEKTLGGSKPHTNMPPYLTVNMYVRKE